MTEVLDRPRTATGARGWAVVVGNGVLGLVGAVPAALWWATARGFGQRWGWVRHPDPTMYRDGLEPWVLLAVVATAVDLGLVLGLNAVVDRLLPVGPTPRRRLVAVAVHLAVAAAVAAAYLAR